MNNQGVMRDPTLCGPKREKTWSEMNVDEKLNLLRVALDAAGEVAFADNSRLHELETTVALHGHDETGEASIPVSHKLGQANMVAPPGWNPWNSWRHSLGGD